MKKFFYEYGQLNWLYVLFCANVVGFLIAFFAFMFSDGNSVLFFAIHSEDKWSLLKVWKLATYAFTDNNVRGLIGNLIWLWLFGETLGSLIGSVHIFRIYVFVTIVLGIVAGVFCLFASDKYPVFLLGFDLVTIALAAACIYKVPDQQIRFMIVGSIPIWIIGVAFLLYKIFAFPSKAMALNLILSISAALLGFVYMLTINKNQYLFKRKGNSHFFSPLFKKKKQGKLVAIKGNKDRLSK